MGIVTWKIDGKYPTKDCLICGKLIEVKERARWDRTKYCSIKCRGKGSQKILPDFNEIKILRCSVCKFEMPKENFVKDASKTMRGGYSYTCLPCQREHSANMDKKRSWKDRRNSYLKRKFGISLSEYEDMLVKQSGVCAICGKPEQTDRSLAVDHCHETGFVRGLLCVKCNTGMGNLGDNVEILQKAIDYLLAATPSWES